jgi:hypothetical protein
VFFVFLLAHLQYSNVQELFHNIILYDKKLAGMCAGSLSKISASQSSQIRKTYKSRYPGYKAIFSALPAGTEFHWHAYDYTDG